jgi:5-methylcytosine-specific restriction endonuclease McrA
MADEIISCAEAKAQGLKSYFTGKPCLRGHIARRYVLNATCAACDAEKSRAYHRRRDPERVREAARQWRAANPDKVAASRQREAVKAATAEAKAKRAKYYEANRERFLQKFKERYRADPMRDRAQQREWKENNKERWRENFRMRASRRRALMRGSSGRHTKEDLAEILELQKHRCAYCQADLRKVAKQVDHIIPISRGGSDNRSNIQYLCRECNQKKNAHDPIDFARSRGLLL